MAMENGPGLKIYFLLNMGIFQPAMLVYQGVPEKKWWMDDVVRPASLRYTFNFFDTVTRVKIPWVQWEKRFQDYPKKVSNNLRFTWANYNDQTAEVTLNGGLVRESPQNPLNSGLGIILICPDLSIVWFKIRNLHMRGLFR